jgi:alkylated DNA repair dioxygenase AlkB
MAELELELIREPEEKEIPGIQYIPDYINIEEQNQLLNNIDQQGWSLDSVDLTRRIQQHGYRLDYKDGLLVSSTNVGDLPDWADSIASRLFRDGFTQTAFDQATVNEYLPGQGVRSHIDCTTCFGRTIAVISLGSSCVMELTHSQTGETGAILLSPGSLLVLQRAARYIWQHSIPACEVDKYKGKEFVRTRRVSLTFREVLFPHK